MTNSEHPRYAGDVIFLKNGVAIIANQAINREKIDRASVFSALFTPKVITNDLLQDASVDSRVIKVNSVALTRLQTVSEGTFLGRLPGTGTGDLVQIPLETAKTALNYVSNQILFDTSSTDLATNSIYAVISALDARIDGIETTGIDLAANYAWTGTHSFAQNVAINASLTTTGTVNGRNLVADGSKLDGIEAGATADMTASEILTALLTVDGSGSGLDSQLLAGQSGTYYLDWVNTTNKPNINITVNLTGDVTGSGSHTFNSLADGSIDIATTSATNALVPRQETPPSGASDGTLWWHSAQGNLKIRYNGAWVDAFTVLGGENVQNMPSRGVIPHTTAVIAHNYVELASILAFKSYFLQKLVVDNAARVRIYADEASQTADETRPIGNPVPPTVNLVYEKVTAGPETLTVVPFIAGGNVENPAVNYLYLSTTNLSGSTTAIAVQLMLLQLEA